MKKPTRRQLEKLVSQMSAELLATKKQKEVDRLRENNRYEAFNHIADGVAALKIVGRAIVLDRADIKDSCHDAISPDDVTGAARCIAHSLDAALHAPDGFWNNI